MSFDLSQWGAVVAGLLVIAIETIYGRLSSGARRGLLSLWIGVGLLFLELMVPVQEEESVEATDSRSDKTPRP